MSDDFQEKEDLFKNNTSYLPTQISMDDNTRDYTDYSDVILNNQNRLDKLVELETLQANG